MNSVVNAILRQQLLMSGMQLGKTADEMAQMVALIGPPAPAAVPLVPPPPPAPPLAAADIIVQNIAEQIDPQGFGQ